MLVRLSDYEPIVYGSYDIRVGFEDLEKTCMVSTHNESRNNKETLFPGSQRRKTIIMVGSSNEEKDSEIRLDRLEQSITTLTLLVMQLAEKDTEAT